VRCVADLMRNWISAGGEFKNYKKNRWPLMSRGRRSEVAINQRADNAVFGIDA